MTGHQPFHKGSVSHDCAKVFFKKKIIYIFKNNLKNNYYHTFTHTNFISYINPLTF